MRLPATNAITLPETNDEWFVADGSELAPVWDLAALRQRMLPGYAREGASDLRDAHLVAWAQIGNRAHTVASLFLGAQITPRNAWGSLLDAFGARLKMPRVPFETDAEYRLRLLEAIEIISPDAIRSAVDALVNERAAPAEVAYQEPYTDGQFWMFDEGDGATWSSFWQPDDGIRWAYYPDNVNPTCGGYWLPERLAPLFWIILPLPFEDSSESPFWLADSVVTSTDPLLGDNDFWMFDAGSGATWNAFWATDITSLWAQIVGAVERRRGAGVSWEMWVDDNLSRSA